MRIKDNFKKGSVEMIILSLLLKEDLYGYEMSQRIEDRGGGYINIPEGSLYPTLHKLQDKKTITSYKKHVKKNMYRIYYHITEEGIAYYNTMKSDYYLINEAIRNIIEYEEDE